jgi:transposase
VYALTTCRLVRAKPLVLTEKERQELQQMTQSRTPPAGDVMRSRMILLLSDGVAYQKIQDLLDTTAPTISRWKRRFLQHRIAGLMEELHPGQQPSVRTPKLQAKVLAAIQEGPKDGSTHWSCRKLASKLHVSKDTIQRMSRQLLRHIRASSKTARPFRWKYSDVRRRILRANELAATGH